MTNPARMDGAHRTVEIIDTQSLIAYLIVAF